MLKHLFSLVLDVIRKAPVNMPLSLAEITGRVANSARDLSDIYDSEWWWPDFFDSSEMPIGQYYVDEILHEAKELGLVSLSVVEGSEREEQRWGLADTWQPERKDDGLGEGARGGGGGGRVGGPNGGNNGDGDNQRPGGISEILGHPLLFSLAGPDFDALVDGLFEEGGS